MFVGEAPGRLGADASSLPFHGDKAGRNFESLIDQVQLNRYDVFVTNAVLCNPKDQDGNNATPSEGEINNCSDFLREQIELVNPRVVATLGASALRGCGKVRSHTLTLKNVRSSNSWFNRTLIPIYHPGQRAMLHRSFLNQLADYQFVAEFVRRSIKGKKRSKGQSSNEAPHTQIGAVAQRLIAQSGGLSYFALHKLFFLTEVAYLEATASRLTNAYIVRQKDGPYCVELHIQSLQKLLPEVAILQRSSEPMLHINLPCEMLDIGETSLNKHARAIVDDVADRYGSMSDDRLKTIAYLATPMRALLRKERRLGVNLFNTPVLPPAESELAFS